MTALSAEKMIELAVEAVLGCRLVGAEGEISPGIQKMLRDTIVREIETLPTTEEGLVEYLDKVERVRQSRELLNRIHRGSEEMTNSEALSRAIEALRKARDDSDHFDHGDLASHEIVELIEDALRVEFSKQD